MKIKTGSSISTSLGVVALRTIALAPDDGNGGGGAPAPVPPAPATDAQAEAIIASAVAKAMAPVQKEIADTLAQLKTTKATSHTAGLRDAGTTEQGERPVVTGGSQVKAPEGIGAARIIKAQMIAKMRNVSPVEVLKAWGYEREASAVAKAQTEVVQRALGQGTLADGGVLVPTEFSSEIIALLRNKTAVRQLGARAVPMGASLEIPRQSSSASAHYVGENLPVAPSQPGTGSIRLTEKKLMALVPMSNDLIRNASVSAEQFVRDDLVQAIALKEDSTAVFGTGGEYSPRGLASLVDGSHAYNTTASTQNAPTLAEVKKELAKAKRYLKSANIPMSRLGWIISPRTEEYLYGITDGNGNSVFQAALDSGSLHGAPLVVTNQIPENLTWSVDASTDVTRIVFGDFDQFIIGESMGLEVEMFPNATYDSNGAGTIVSGISSDQSVVRAIAKHDFNLRHTKSFVVVSARWGA